MLLSIFWKPGNQILKNLNSYIPISMTQEKNKNSKIILFYISFMKEILVLSIL